MRGNVFLAVLSVMIISFATATNLNAKKQKNHDLDCGAVFTKDYAFAYFPVVNKRTQWEWYKFEITPERAEYAWIAEPGKYKKKEFISNGVAFVISLGTANLENNSLKMGSLDDLIKETSKNAYYTKKPKNSAEEDKNIDFIFKSKVRAKKIEDGSISIYPADPETIKEVKRGSPTHMKLKAILPNEDESYECIVKIEHMELVR